MYFGILPNQNYFKLIDKTVAGGFLDQVRNTYLTPNAYKGGLWSVMLRKASYYQEPRCVNHAASLPCLFFFK
jgi:hypothetical protein